MDCARSSLSSSVSLSVAPLAALHKHSISDSRQLPTRWRDIKSATLEVKHEAHSNSLKPSPCQLVCRTPGTIAKAHSISSSRRLTITHFSDEGGRLDVQITQKVKQWAHAICLISFTCQHVCCTCKSRRDPCHLSENCTAAGGRLAADSLRHMPAWVQHKRYRMKISLGVS